MVGKKIRIPLLLAVLIAGSVMTVHAVPLRMKVMTFNVRMSGELTVYDVKPFATIIREYNPDVVALQEVDFRVARSNQIDFATLLAAELGMFPVFGKAIASGSGEYGPAILSRYPVMMAKTELLPKPEGTKEQRAVVIAEILLPSGQKARIASTHLDHSTPEVRTAMATVLNGYLLKGDMPTILGGDFNAKPDESTIASVMQQWKRICNDNPTFPNIPTSKIDYLFGYPKSGLVVLNTVVIERTNISDHCPVFAEIEFQ